MDVRDLYRGLFTKEESEDAREGRNAYEYGQVEAQQEHYNNKTGSDVENVDNFRFEGKESESNKNDGSWQLDKNHFEDKDANFVEGDRGQDLLENKTERVHKAEDEAKKDFEETIQTKIGKRTEARPEEDFDNIAGLLKHESALLVTTEGRDTRNGAEDELEREKGITNESADEDADDEEDVIEDGFEKGLEYEAVGQHTGKFKEILKDEGGGNHEGDRDELSWKTKVGLKYKIQIAKEKVHSDTRDGFLDKMDKYPKDVEKYDEKEARDGNFVNVKMEDKIRTAAEKSRPQQWYHYPTPLPRPGRKREPWLFSPKS